MHRIISNYLKEFCEDNFVSLNEAEDKRFEYFINYCIAYSMYPGNFEYADLTTDDMDSGIDGIVFLVDGELVATLEEAKKIFSRPKKNIQVEICFIQTKTSESYDRGDILKFGDGVMDFISESPNLPHGDFLEIAKKIFDFIIENVSKIQNGRPEISLKYVCTSSNEVAQEIEATRKNIEKRLKQIGFFYSVDFKLLGLNQVIELWGNTNNAISALLPIGKWAPYPTMVGVTEAYIVIVSIKDYIENILTDANGRMRSYIYEENVRAFLGIDNPVNDKIRTTLIDQHKSDKFAIYNNGITIISPDVRIQSDKISIQNYQIVNGCQTSNVLFECRDSVSPDAMLTVKIVEATDQDVIADIVKATNSQSKVDENQFLSFSPFVRRLEKHFDATEDIEGKEIKLYFERRNGQYRNSEVPKKKVFSIGETCRAVGAIFLIVPDMASRYPTRFLSQMQNDLFDERNKEEAYYAAAVVDYRFKQLCTKGKLLNKYAIYKWHILTVFGFVVTGKPPASLKNKKQVVSYCNKLLAICFNEEEYVLAFQQTIDIIEEIGLKSNRDEVRSTGYAKEIKDYCCKNLIK